MIEPLRILDDAVEILDQRRLPEEETYWHCTSADDVVQAIRSLAIRGAPLIGVAGCYGLWLEAKRLKDQANFYESLDQAKAYIISARPTAVNLSWAVERVWREVDPERPPLETIEMLLQEATRLGVEEWERNRQIAAWGTSLLTSSSNILTHCNTGSLATVGMGTALGIIRHAFHAGLVDHVWVDETRPLLQGARLTAWELDREGIPLSLITDSMAASVMNQGRVDVVIVGADRICTNGDTANKIGTYSLAVLAHYHKIPFYVAAPTSTIDASLKDGSLIPIEERDADEVRKVRQCQIAPPGISAYNPAFDVTPGSLITAIITEKGVARPPFQTSLALWMKPAEQERVQDND